MKKMNAFNVNKDTTHDFISWLQQGCANEGVLELFHGSNYTIQKPDFNFNNTDNDYGKGFYTTPYRNRAEEWSWLFGDEKAKHICNSYLLDLSGLKIINLDTFGPLAWIAEIAYNRGVRVQKQIIDKFISMYKIDTSDADIICGYRADDSYSEVIQYFFEGKLNIEEVKRLFYKGNLGEQVLIKSELAFNKLTFSEDILVENCDVSYDSLARREVSKFLQNRDLAILMQGYNVQGMTLQAVLSYKYNYNKEGCYYE